MVNRPTLADLIVKTAAGNEDELRDALRACVEASDIRVPEIAAYVGIGELGLRKLLSGGSNAPSAMTLLRLMVVLPDFAEQLGFKALIHAA